MHSSEKLELMANVTAHAFKEAAQHISGRFRGENRLACAHLQQLQLDLLPKALVFNVLEAEPLDQFAPIAVAHGEKGKQHRFLGIVGLLDQRADHSGDVKALLAIEPIRQGIGDALKKITKPHLTVEEHAKVHWDFSSRRHSQYPDRGDHSPDEESFGTVVPALIWIKAALDGPL